MIKQQMIKTKLVQLPRKYYRAISILPNLIDWDVICRVYRLDETFIEKHMKYIDTTLLVIHQQLSLSFIEKYKSILNPHIYCMYQKLSEKFIRDNMDDLFLPAVLLYQDISDKLREEIIEKTSSVFECKKSEIMDNLKVQPHTNKQLVTSIPQPMCYTCKCGILKGAIHNTHICQECGNECSVVYM